MFGEVSQPEFVADMCLSGENFFPRRLKLSV